MNTQQLRDNFRAAIPAGFEPCSLRVVDRRDELIEVRQGVLQPLRRSRDRGAMVSLTLGDRDLYAATADLSGSGLSQALERVQRWRDALGPWASRVARSPSTAEQSPSADVSASERREGSIEQPLATAPCMGRREGPVEQPLAAVPLAERIDRIRRAAEALRIHDTIVDWSGSLWSIELDVLYLTSDGVQLEQHHSLVIPQLLAVAHESGETQRRSFGGQAYCRRGGLEVLDHVGFDTAPRRVAEEARQLLAAPDCPSGTMDLLLGPDQMILQIHESIGHPLELDRILGDERNYAGTSFVTREMFGSYRYGSELLNVTFDPERAEQLASYGYDDAGLPARREYVIRDGVLLRPLGGASSQRRAGLPGVACARASGWNRPPIDRMANLNVEPGDASFEQLVSSVERGVLMRTNRSWSIDDARNKFQFGCEFAQQIEDGELGPVVKNPNYRGISATFWRSLRGVGDQATFEVLGSPYCGKGEPNQLIYVGHASPTCLFGDVDVFGGQ